MVSGKNSIVITTGRVRITNHLVIVEYRLPSIFILLTEYNSEITDENIIFDEASKNATNPAKVAAILYIPTISEVIYIPSITLSILVSMTFIKEINIKVKE
jgi:hypothetical protein